MTDQPAPEDQSALWNGAAGRGWVEAQDITDRMLRPFEAMLLQGISAGARVLDVGCGTGATTLAIARRVGPRGRATGVDISAPMLAAARERAEREGVPMTFLQADAESWTFEAGSLDAIVSRFGVMFFSDPVRAFGNLRGATAPGGRLRFIAFRTPAENAFLTTAERAAAPLLPELPPKRPDGPGQFAFADRARVETILRDSGWQEIVLAPVDVELSLPARDLDRYLTSLGPVARALQEVDEARRREVIATVRRAFEPYSSGEEVRGTAACWLVEAVGGTT